MDEHRQHRRLVVRLPIECCPADGPRDVLMRAMTGNISTGGVYFEMDIPPGHQPPAPRDLLDVDLTVPPGDGHFPYEGRIRSTVEVLRSERLAAGSGVPGVPRVGIAARFHEPLKYEF